MWELPLGVPERTQEVWSCPVWHCEETCLIPGAGEKMDIRMCVKFELCCNGIVTQVLGQSCTAFCFALLQPLWLLHSSLCTSQGCRSDLQYVPPSQHLPVIWWFEQYFWGIPSVFKLGVSCLVVPFPCLVKGSVPASHHLLTGHMELSDPAFLNPLPFSFSCLGRGCSGWIVQWERALLADCVCPGSYGARYVYRAASGWSKG